VERHFCEACARRTLWLPNPAAQGAVEKPAGVVAEVTVQVERVLFTGSDMQLLVLREAGGPRRLAFGIGYVEATAVWWTLKREPSPRPLTHQAWVDTVAALGAEIRSAGVVARRDDIYLAELRLVRDGAPAIIDVRPSDAILFALRAGVPFSFTEPLLAADSVSEPEPAESDGM
jgi:bifunctional DNase/RNase